MHCIIRGSMKIHIRMTKQKTFLRILSGLRANSRPEAHGMQWSQKTAGNPQLLWADFIAAGL